MEVGSLKHNALMRCGAAQGEGITAQLVHQGKGETFKEGGEKQKGAKPSLGLRDNHHPNWLGEKN